MHGTAQKPSEYKCPGRIKTPGGTVIGCRLGEHEEGHRNGSHHWYDDMQGAFRTDEPTTRVTFDGGGMRDSQTGKPRFDLLMPEKVPYDQQYLTRVARLMARGADHYEDRNWEKFDSQEALDRAKSSAIRHFMQWINGETDEDHAASIFFNVMAVEYVKGRMNGDW